MLIQCIVFMIGSCIFSFLNVVAYRYPKGISFIKGYSYCPTCHHRLYPLDLIPIMSYFLLKGKCHYCHHSIGIRDTINEFIGGIVILHCLYNEYGVIYFLFFCILDIISLIDLDTYNVYDCFLYCLLVLSIVSLFVFDYSFMNRFLGGFLISLSLFLMNFIVHDSFGGGDIRFIFISGLFLGSYYLCVGIYISFIIAGLYAGYLMIKKLKSIKDHLAFIPFLSIGLFISVFYSSMLINLLEKMIIL